MTDDKGRKKRFGIYAVIILNVTLVVCVILAVVFAFNNAEQASFSQNIENVRTLTNASANKVELEIFHDKQEVASVSQYINGYMGRGMTEEEVITYFQTVLPKQDDSVYSWQLVNSGLNGKVGSAKGINAIAINGENNEFFSYTIQEYGDLTKIFYAANEDMLGIIRTTSEFTDASSRLQKSFAVLTTVKLLEDEESGVYQYHTLMLLVSSKYINELISNNNEVDNLSFFDYSNIIIDNNGDYVISNSSFQGTNMNDYIELYNDGYTKEQGKIMQDNLKTEDYAAVLYYQNNREQDCAYTIVPIQNSEWHILSIVPLSSFHNEYDFNRNFILFAVFFALLFFVDIVYVMGMNRQLRRKTNEAQAASVAKSQFLSSMSHDIRTPMNAIIGMTQIAEDNLLEEEADIETIRDCIRTIRLSGNHLLTLINDILDISIIETGRISISEDDFSIAETLGKMMEIVQPQIKEKHLNFETHIVNVQHEYVHADELRINQIYINILSNAIKYTNQEGTVTVDFREEAIPKTTDKIRYIYRVSDTGIGMSPEFLKLIFNRFSRAVDTRVNTTQGTGLGMAISKQLVDLMGGTITVESELNVGSTFTVTLDLPIAVSSAVGREEKLSLGDVSVLLIDNDATLLETAEDCLVKAGVRVDTAIDAQEGIRKAVTKQQRKPYDVIFVDWKMPIMSGMEVVKELKRELQEETKIVVMTAYSITDIEHTARMAGADGFITKPLFQSKLLHAISDMMSGAVKQTGERAEKIVFQLNVLVVEDNIINWKVLTKLLNWYGIDPDRAENGQNALDMIEKKETPYDLIFMDIQMPVMNGYEATEAIRKMENQAKANVPIYAMTADTFAEDVNRCLAKGMNGHLAKPIEVDKLIKILTQISNQNNRS